MTRVKIETLFFVLLLGITPALLQGQGESPLKLEEIMKGEEWVGNQPARVDWLNQSNYLFFNWNPDNKASTPQYCYNIKTGELKITGDDVKNSLPPRVQVYDSNRSRYLYVENGDLYMCQVKTGRITRLTNTLENLLSPGFSIDGKEIIYQSGLNFFKRDLQSGLVTQLTDFRQGSAGGRQSDGSQSRGGTVASQGGQFQGGMTAVQGGQFLGGSDPATRRSDSLGEQDRWLRAQQLNLFDYLKTREKERELQRGQWGAAGLTTGARESDTSWQNRKPLTITLDAGGARSIIISPDQRFVSWITFQAPPSQSRNTLVPNYVTASGYVENITARAKVGAAAGSSTVSIYDREKRKSYSVDPSTIPGIREVPGYMYEYGFTGKELEADRAVTFGNLLWSGDGSHAVVNITSGDNKDRWIMLLDPESGDLKLLDRQHDEGWIGGPGISRGSMGFMPDNRRLWFQSEESGYSHLYTVDVVTGEKRALTSGRFEVYSPSISKDKKWWYFSSNEVHPGERHFYRMPLDGGVRTRITTMTGNNEVALSPDERWLAIRYSYSNKPWEIYIMENRPGAEALKLTSSPSPEFLAYKWRDPQVISFSAADGADVYARLYLPEPSVKNSAAVIFVHGAGYLQNAHKWWSQYFREYMFHNLLTDLGYTVLDIDYRGSSGYGRDWRTGIYRHMGGKDLSDHVDGVRYLVNHHGVDAKRIGIYGGSYGGFITLMAMFTEPDLFAAGAGLRSVTDWAHYNHGYTSNILNLPYTDSIAYYRSSPINFASGLKGRLLMCHGIIDDNVEFQDIIRLSQRLIELGKDDWELAVYPVEKHSFTETSSWIDEYRRILKLFNETLLK